MFVILLGRGGVRTPILPPDPPLQTVEQSEPKSCPKPKLQTFFIVCFKVSLYNWAPLGTVSLGAIGFMSIRNKSLRTLINPNFCSADTWSRFIFILEILFSQTAPISLINSVLFPLLENTFSRSVYYWAGAAGNIHVEKSTVSTNSKMF